MTSTLKVQNIQYTDGDAALTIADGGGVTAASTLGVTGASTLSNKLTVSAADGTADNDWVMEVRNDEQTNDRSFGLKVSAGSTVTDTALDVRDHTSASNFLQVSGVGFVSRPQAPALQATKNSTTQTQTISGSSVYVITGLDSSYGNSYSVNNKSYFDSSTSRFLVPAGTATGYYFCSLQTILGITRPSSGTNWGYLGIRKNNTQSALSNNYFTEAYREVVSTSGVAATVWETINVTGVIKLAEYDYVEPIFGGSAGEDMKVHSGNYTNFSVIQIA